MCAFRQNGEEAKNCCKENDPEMHLWQPLGGGDEIAEPLQVRENQISLFIEVERLGRDQIYFSRGIG